MRRHYFHTNIVHCHAAEVNLINIGDILTVLSPERAISCLFSWPLRGNDWQKNNVALNNREQLVSHGEVVGRTGRHTARLCDVADGHQSPVRLFLRSCLPSKCFPLGFSPEQRAERAGRAGKAYRPAPAADNHTGGPEEDPLLKSSWGWILLEAGGMS